MDYIENQGHICPKLSTSIIIPFYKRAYFIFNIRTFVNVLKLKKGTSTACSSSNTILMGFVTPINTIFVGFVTSTNTILAGFVTSKKDFNQ